MTVSLPAPPLLLITDRQGAALDMEQVVAAAFRAGCRWVMVRNKGLATEALAGLAGRIVAAGRPFAARVVVNGDPAAAERAGAAGVHLQSAANVAQVRGMLGAGALIGVSVHAPTEARHAARAGADYVTVSPVFATASKPGYGPDDDAGLALLRTVADEISMPAIALAGVTADNAAACLAAGAAGVAVMGSVMRAADPGAVVRGLIAALASADHR
jgi:thiamine-phosphate pyrophosphorylase